MKNEILTVQAYLETLSEPFRDETEEIRCFINRHLPPGFHETIQYNMISWVVPLTIYPAGYEASKNQPLPFISLARQKNHIAIYHMGVYAYPGLMEWFIKQYQAESGKLPDMGKSCIRFKSSGEIPRNTLKALLSKMDVATWAAYYDSQRKKKEAHTKRPPHPKGNNDTISNPF
jgi:uncharacterized protein YdhG (YjbR/CyaY superfamily)